MVVKNGSNICSASCGRNPMPVSLTETRICSSSARCYLMTISRIPSTSLIASMPLTIGFIATCCNCTRSPTIRGRSAANSVRTNTLSHRLIAPQSHDLLIDPPRIKHLPIRQPQEVDQPKALLQELSGSNQVPRMHSAPTGH